MSTQLKKISEALSETFFEQVSIQTPSHWDEAFNILKQKFEKLKKKVVIFLDELPWMATSKSGLLEEIDYFWNKYWSSNSNVIFIVCGSSASWLIRKIIYNKGGLHNRTTCQIKLNPFNLHETCAYFESRKIKLNQVHIVTIYMTLGGIPYYLKYVSSGLSATENIQAILFDKNAPLKDEFDILFASLFGDAKTYVELLHLIATKKEGMLRSELKALVHSSGTGGRLSKKLEDLKTTGIIEGHIILDRTKGEYYKLTDEFTLFYLQWIFPNKNKKFLKDHWITESQKPSYFLWAGYAFEALCMKHIAQIVYALKIETSSAISSWRYIPKTKEENGTQIELIIDRTDNAMTLCEIKYTMQPFVIDKAYSKKLLERIELFQTKTKTKKQLFFAMICSSGLKENMYSEAVVDGGVVVLQDLFMSES